MDDAPPLRTLVIETATAACSVALFEGQRLVARHHEVVGRGHAERLVPMIGDLPMQGRAGTVIVDVGPGSFTGLRVGIAAAIGLGIGWGASTWGLSSLALIAAGAVRDFRLDGEFAVAIEGGHGEVFVQQFLSAPLTALDDPVSLPPDMARSRIGGKPIVGNAARRLVDIAVLDALPDAANALLLPGSMRRLPPRPLYLRAPDAKLPGGTAPP